MKAAVLRYLLFAAMAFTAGACGSPPVQHEPELHPYGQGIKSLQVNCAARMGTIRPLIGTNRGPVTRPGSPEAASITLARLTLCGDASG